MQPRTRLLAACVQQAVVALSDENLLETSEHWLTILQARFEWIEMLEDDCESLGYRVRSATTGQEYASLCELDEAEPEVEEICWVTPDMQVFRERLRKMPPKHFYHQVITLAGLVFREKPCAAQWGEPPSGQCDGSAFMQALAHDLTLKREADPLSSEQFEALPDEELAALEERNQTERGGDEWFADVYPHERQRHFHSECSASTETKPHVLIEVLQRYGCTVRTELTESGIEGFCESIPWHKEALKTLSRVRHLLNRWQRHEVIGWSYGKVKAPKRQPSPQRKRQQKTTRRSRSTSKK
jgi:hypothetical protein